MSEIPDDIGSLAVESPIDGSKRYTHGVPVRLMLDRLEGLYCSSDHPLVRASVAEYAARIVQWCPFVDERLDLSELWGKRTVWAARDIVASFRAVAEQAGDKIGEDGEVEVTAEKES